MMKLFAAFALWGLIVQVHGHAKLNAPTAWNPQPSKTSPCGGASAPGTPAAEWPVGSVQTVTWQVVAGDGAGPVSAYFDIDGGTTNFTATFFENQASPNVATIDITGVVPDIKCRNTNGICSLQVKSSSAWYGCTSIKILPAGSQAEVVELPRDCTKLDPELKFCTMKKGISLTIWLGGLSPAAKDALAANTYNATILNTNVFANGADPACADAYKQYLCDQTFPECGETAACNDVCSKAMTACQVTESHKALYDCTTAPDCVNAGASLIASVALLVAAVFALLA